MIGAVSGPPLGVERTGRYSRRWTPKRARLGPRSKDRKWRRKLAARGGRQGLKPARSRWAGAKGRMRVNPGQCSGRTRLEASCPLSGWGAQAAQFIQIMARAKRPRPCRRAGSPRGIVSSAAIVSKGVVAAPCIMPYLISAFHRSGAFIV